MGREEEERDRLYTGCTGAGEQKEERLKEGGCYNSNANYKAVGNTAGWWRRQRQWQRQVGLCEFKASLVYKESSRAARAIKKNSVLSIKWAYFLQGKKMTPGHLKARVKNGHQPGDPWLLC